MTMPLALLVPLMCSGLLFAVVALTKRDATHPAFWLSLMYFGSAASALFVNVDLLRSYGLETLDSDWIVLLAYGLSLVLCLLPALFMKNWNSTLLATGTVERIAVVSAPLVIFSFLYLLPFAWEGATRGAAEVRAELNDLGISILPVSPWTTVAVVVAQFYPAFALLFVIATARGGSRFARIVLFIGSTLYLLNALCFAARDGFLWFLVAYLWALWYARPALAERTRRALRRTVVPVALGGMVLFAVFSIQRFGDRSEATTLEYLVAYYGFQPHVFATTVREQHEFYGGRLRFPLFVDPTEARGKVLRTVPYEWSFGTFMKDLYSEGGWVFVFVFVVLAPATTLGLLCLSSGNNPAGYALVSMVYVQFMAQGVFYLRMGMRAGNLYLLCIALFVVASFMWRVHPGGRAVQAIR